MGVIDLKGIKTNLKAILDTANVIGGNPIDLSNQMAVRVAKVLMVDVKKIPIQPSFFPCLTMFFGGKKITLKDIASTMLAGRREGMINMTLVGLVWNDNISTANFQLTDGADIECEYMMENAEQVLRLDPTLGGKVLYTFPDNVTYHDFPISEEAHMRAGLMNLQMKVIY